MNSLLMEKPHEMAHKQNNQTYVKVAWCSKVFFTTILPYLYEMMAGSVTSIKAVFLWHNSYRMKSVT